MDEPQVVPENRVPGETLRWRKWFWLLLVAGFFVYMVALPVGSWWLDSQREKPTVQTIDDLTLAEAIRIRSIQIVCCLWFVFLGGAVGSFLNVVAGSLPRGEPLVLRRSMCPVCGATILRRDNLPVIGYLNLGGRCRSCGVTIPIRYLVVELLAALIFTSLFFVELISGGVNIPVRQPNHFAGIVWILLYTKWDLVGLYAYHCLMLCVLLTGALMRWDGYPIRRSWMFIVVLAFGLPPILIPDLQVVPIHAAFRQAFQASPLTGRILAVCLGGVVGAMLSYGLNVGLARGTGRLSKWPRRGGGFEGLGLVGIVLGWQAAMTTAMIALPLWMAVAMTRNLHRLWRHTPGLAMVFVAALLYQQVWRQLPERLGSWWPSHHSTPLQVLVLTVGLFSGAVCLGWMAKRKRKSPKGGC